MRKAAAGIAAGGGARKDDVVADPQRGDAALVGGAREGGQRLARGERTLVREVAADIHRGPIIPRRREGRPLWHNAPRLRPRRFAMRQLAALVLVVVLGAALPAHAV